MPGNAAVVIALALGAVAGGAAVHSLGAEAKPPVYFVAENDVVDAEGYRKEYLPLAKASIQAHGGKYLAAGIATPFAGEPPKSRVVILVWESQEQLQQWFQSSEYRQARAVGEKYARYRNYAVAGVAK